MFKAPTHQPGGLLESATRARKKDDDLCLLHGVYDAWPTGRPRQIARALRTLNNAHAVRSKTKQLFIGASYKSQRRVLRASYGHANIHRMIHSKRTCHMYKAQRRACLVSYATTCLVHYGGILQVASLVAPQLPRCKGGVRAPALHFSHHFVHRRGIGTGRMEMGSKARVVGKIRLCALVTLLFCSNPTILPCSVYMRPS